jgi:hypothetical protein
MTDASLKNLTSLSKSLNEASDALSNQIARIEAALNELKLGLTVWVVISRSFSESGDSYEESLGYGKSAGKWGLLYATELSDEPESWSVVFLRDAPRLEKIEAVKKLPVLLEAIEAKAAEVTKLASEQAAQIAEVAAALDKSRGRS